jgi:hypothetical protein
MTDNTRLRLTGHGRAASSALDLFDTTTSSELKGLVDHTKVMESKPTQEAAD